jgi:glycine oxidase
MQQVDVLIIGQGMAGTALSLELINRNISFKVIDNNHNQSSSIMSAGMYNPIVFKRITKSWLADESQPFLKKFCSTMESLVGNSYHHQTPVARLFTNLQEQNLWFDKMDSPLFEAYLEDEKTKLPDVISCKNGYGIVNKTGDVTLSELLPKYQDWLVKKQLISLEKFDYSLLHKHESLWKYKGNTAKHVVFCEGFQALYNPFFSWAPIKPNKGQLLVILCAGLNLTCVINAGFFIQPLGDDTYRVGSTYQWDETDDTPTEDKKQELLNKLNSVIEIPFEVIKHTAGIRPTVLDRRPLLGEHPIEKGLYMFNGFGAKAVMLAPYCANEFCNYLFDGEPLEREININRYYKLFE